MIFREVSHGRTADTVTAQIEDLVLDGVLRPGDRLPPERELARAFDVSRPILREAIGDLEARGLVTSRHGGGTFVADVIGEVFREPVVALIRSRPKARADYMEFRRELDAVAAGLAAEQASEADLARLAHIVAALGEAHQETDPRREAELDVEFHVAISEATHNVVLLHMLRAGYRLLADGVFYNRDLLFTQADSRDRLYAQHLAIHRAIAGRDATAARTEAAAHMDYVAQTVAARERAAAREVVAERRLMVADLRLDEMKSGDGPRRGRRGPAVGVDLAERAATGADHDDAGAAGGPIDSEAGRAGGQGRRTHG